MDDLDRLYYEFVEALRRERPSRLTDRFTVLELREEIIPYRRVRNSVGFRSNDDYETVLSRLLAGERGYLLGDAVMQDEIRAGLQKALPDIRRYRAFPDLQVHLDPGKIPPPGDIRYAPPEVRQRSEWTSTAVEVEDAELGVSVSAEASEAEPSPGSHSPAVGSESETGAVTESEEATSAEEEVVGSDPTAEGERRREVGEVATSEPVTRPPEPTMQLELCPQCGSDLPEEAAFCPFCGSRISPERCTHCGAAIEPAWRFCAMCGVSRAGDPQELS